MAMVLIVDDEEPLALILTHALRAAGHTPMNAATGHGALLAARAHPDLILLDLGLPDISGDEVLRRLKRDPHTANIPVVVVSGRPNAAEVVTRNGATGAVAIMHKPVLGSELCAVAEVVLQARQAREWGVEGPTRRGADAGYRQHNEMLYRLISTASGPLVQQICHRVGADRARGTLFRAVEAPSWPEIIRRAKQEGLLEEAEGRSFLQRATCQPAEPIV